MILYSPKFTIVIILLLLYFAKLNFKGTHCSGSSTERNMKEQQT